MVKFELNKSGERIKILKLKKLEKIVSAEFKKNGLISIAFVGKETIKRLNKDYRFKDKATDVLTFVMGERGDEYLGEILLCLKEIKKRAKVSGKSQEETAVYLIVHGTCHIFGFTHNNKKNTEEMEKREKRILGNYNLC
ncbi:MAG: rRNA maturation RNase YbeY [Patescibacteria group bacterium]